MEDVDDVLSYLKLDPDHHEKIAALIPKVCFPQLFQLCFVKGKHEANLANLRVNLLYGLSLNNNMALIRIFCCSNK